MSYELIGGVLVDAGNPASPEYVIERTPEPGGEFHDFRFTVVGKGDFPLDMLRYDQCWPADGNAAADIAHPSERGMPELRHESREVRLQARRHKFWLPTVGRWRSFGWIVKTTA